MLTTADPSLHETLTKARERLANIRTAIAEATVRADETERARIAAEKSYVDQVASAMLDGKSTPAKSAELKKLQADDDIADAALESLRQRVSQIEGEVRSAAARLMRAKAEKLSALRAKQAIDACDQIIPAFAMLVRAVGINEARMIVERLAGDGTWGETTNVEHHEDMNKIHQMVPEVQGTETVLRDLDATAVRPRVADIGDRVVAFLKKPKSAKVIPTEPTHASGTEFFPVI